jgi:hypothetical protein
MEGSMAGTGKPSTAVAAIVLGCAAAVLMPAAAMAQFPIPMIPNFNFGPQHYHTAPSHSYHHSQGNDGGSATTKDKEKDATQDQPTASASTQQKQTSAPPSHDAAPSGGSDAQSSPPPAKKTTDDAPAFAPSR